MEEIIIIGFGGHAKSIADCIERQGMYHIYGYTDVKDNGVKYEYLGNDDVLQSVFDNGVANAVVGIGYLGKGNTRNRIYSLLKDIGYNLPVIIDPSAIVSSSASIGEGVFVGKGAVINTESTIGKMAIINTRALIEHECKIGDFTHVAVTAVVCGQVNIGNDAFIGANSTIIQCMEIKDRGFVPAGAVIR